ncbi:MAG: phosphoribosyl-ATP diphosphatase, partial [Leptospiraceae bacterium]|nr:phosphoribosyl-ATP diphosphatase [Leptospiraceae bacterium]
KRKEELPENSYTSGLFKAGVDRILKKIGEEAGEVIIAAKNTDRKELTHELADLLFHMQVLMVEKELPFQEIINELKKRHSK